MSSIAIANIVAAIIITWSSSITVAAITSPLLSSFLSSYSETSGLDIAPGPGEQICGFSTEVLILYDPQIPYVLVNNRNLYVYDVVILIRRLHNIKSMISICG